MRPISGHLQFDRSNVRNWAVCGTSAFGRHAFESSHAANRPFADITSNSVQAATSDPSQWIGFRMLAAFHLIYDVWRSLIEVISYRDFAFQSSKQPISRGV